VFIFEHQRELFKQALLAGARHIQQDVSGWQELGNSVHQSGA
jgi:hypothetical protein